MPTLIRFFVFLLVLAGLAFGAMLALTLLVDPGEKEMTIKIPARDLVPAPSADPLGIKPSIIIDAPVAPLPNVAPNAAADGAATDGAATDGPAITIEPGPPE